MGGGTGPVSASSGPGNALIERRRVTSRVTILGQLESCLRLKGTHQ